MNFVIANQDTREVVSEHDDLDAVKEAYLPYFNECRREAKRTDNWIFRKKNSGAILDLSAKEQHELRVYFLKQPRS